MLPVELRSALRRRVAERTLDSLRVSEILKRVAADRAYWTVIEVGTGVLNGAEALVSVHPMRTLDAIHVASAQLFASRLSMADLVFVSADKRQTEVASAIGLMTRHVG
jgi:predicted nucleic acid-binding protein